MTIKELEQKTGMTRANIRFYEGEGLLHPKRLDNGYRDYSEEDVRTLEKIRLLRQLQLDIDTIRRVQQGALTLEQALFTQQTKLEGDRGALERAAQVCGELERSGVEYAALDPRPWLRQLQPPPQPGLAPPPAVPAEDVERDNEPRACPHPWQRYFARTLDTLLWDMLLNVLWMVIFRSLGLWRLQTGSPIVRFLWGVAMLAMAIAVEPLWLHFLGWTPGKWLFGLKLRDEDGEKLTLAQARERSWRVAWEGCGWNIPIWGLWRMWQGRKAGLEGRDCPWDGEEGHRYTKVERRVPGALSYVLAVAALLFAVVAAIRWVELPVCRGELTVAQFSQNYDHFQRLLYPAGEYGHLPTLDEEGRWADRSGNGRVTIHYSSGISVAGAGGVQTVEGDVETTTWDQPVFTVEDGRVTAVTLRMESRDGILWPDSSRTAQAMRALSGALDGVNLFNFDVEGWGTMVELMPAWEDAEWNYRGLHVSQRVEHTGYNESLVYDSDLLIRAGEDVPCRCEKTVTISLIEE